MLKKAVIELTSDDTDPIESDQSDTVNQSRSISKKTTKTPERRKAIKLNRGEVPSLSHPKVKFHRDFTNYTYNRL